MSKIKLALLIIIGVLLTLALGAFIYMNVMLSRISRSAETVSDAVITLDLPEPQNTPEPEDEISDGELTLSAEVAQTQLSSEQQAKIDAEEKRKKVTNIVLLGVDRRGSNGNSRSDTCMIATLDGANGRLKLTSLMRDMYVYIPSHGENRFNSACTKGGPALVIETINQNFALDIEHYVQIDFKSFEKAIDILGGMTVEMSEGEVAEANDCIAGLNKQRGDELLDGLIQKRGGTIRLTGKQALGYVRMRKFGDGDFARTSRQFKAMKFVLEKFLGMDVASQQSMMYELLPYVETDMSNTEIIELALKALTIGNFDLMQYRLPAEGMYKSKTIRSMSVLLPDIPANTQALHEFIYEASDQPDIGRTNTSKGVYHPKAAANPTLDAQDEAVPDESEEIIDDGLVADDAVADEAVPDESVPDETVPDESELF